MRTITSILFSGLIFWLTVACKRSASDVSPALNPIGVVDTFVSAKDLSTGGKRASISALAVDSAGNVYAADISNFVIYKISPTGEVRTLAGSGKPGYQNGPAATAQFKHMTSLAIDKAGNVYVGEAYENSCIRKITPAGQVSTFAGKPFILHDLTFDPKSSPDGADTSAQFMSVSALAINSAGDLFAADAGSEVRYSSNAIRKITPDGNVRTIAGYIGDLPYQGQVINNSPHPHYFVSLAINKADKLVGLDLGNKSIFQITPMGNVSELFTRLSFPSSNTSSNTVLYDQAGNLLVASSTKIWQVMPDNRITVLAGADQGGFVNDSLRLARFGLISAMAVDKGGLLYIAEYGSQGIRRVRLN